MKKRSVVVTVVFCATLAVVVATVALGSQSLASVPVDDPIARLEQRLASGATTVSSDEDHGYLEALLEALEIPVASQGLIFSRTSLQTDRITPWSPRAVYFNDDVYVGWVKGSPILEIASIDPDEGAVFYTAAQDGGERPVFTRHTTTCLMCHESKAVTSGVPGVIMRSVLTDRHGYVVDSVHEGATSDRTPFAQRFGGWYVTGTHGEPGHAGNSMSPLLSHEVSDPAGYTREFDFTEEGNLADLDGRFDANPYLSKHSDIVALLVLGHQTHIHNMIILARQSADEARRDQERLLLSTRIDVPESGVLPATQSRIDSAVDRLLREMLFYRGAPLNGPLQGTSGYAEEFVERGPFDSRGRSLRDLDLETRLFRYPLSFLIYTDSFDSLPDIVKDGFYKRLHRVLIGEDDSSDFAHLTESERTAILEILEDTKPEFMERRD